MPSPTRRRFLLIANPIAGHVGRRLLDPVLARLERAGAGIARPSLPTIEAAGIVLREAGGANADGIDAVIAAGGDGTFRMVAAQLLGSRIPIGVLPLGTGNVLAHELELPADPRALAEGLLDGPAIPLRASRANGQPFFLMAGAGFDGAVIARLDHGWKHRVGKLAYVPPVLAALSQPLPRLEVTIDGTRHVAGWVVVSNARCYGGGFALVPHTHAVDAGLHAVLFQARDRLTLTAQLRDLARGRLHGRPDVTVRPARHVTITGVTGTGDRGVPVEVDGDAAGVTPVAITADRSCVQLIVPWSIARGAGLAAGGPRA